MDVSSNSSASQAVDYAGLPPVLVAASSDRALDNAAAAVEAAGFRLAPVTIEEAADRLAIQVAASAVWVEVDEDGIVDSLRSGGIAAHVHNPPLP